MTEEEFRLLAAAAALGALNADDMRTYRAALAEHPEWAALADEDVRTAAVLAELAEDVAPPPALRGRILALIDETSADPETDRGAVRNTPTGESGDAAGADSHESPRTHPHRHRRRRTWFALAASLVLAAGIGTGAVIAIQHATQPASIVALDRIEDAPDAQQATADVTGGGSATLHWSATVGQAVLVTGELPPLTESQTFELWYVRGTTPISAGTFTATGTRTSALLKPGMEPGDTIAVTIEHAGGSPTGQPTTRPILTIPTA
ncbi:anti-sigma factor domain-containing protein [Microbacterium sp.]|uniref:anti-sigma factor n=1 Tax=Microbacterium sp. TaxID=51671 RepID=UPI003A8D293A